MKQKRNFPFALCISMLMLLVFMSCDSGGEVINDCYFQPRSSCASTSFSFVDPETFENLLGYDKAINPDSIVITNLEGDTMYHKVFFWNDWNTVEGFGPFQELYCFNQCKLDSAFTRTYFMYLGCTDTDTIEAVFPEHAPTFTLFFNGLDGTIPKNKPAEMPEYSLFWFRKAI